MQIMYVRQSTKKEPARLLLRNKAICDLIKHVLIKGPSTVGSKYHLHITKFDLIINKNNSQACKQRGQF
jgi:hypothetical protein